MSIKMVFIRSFYVLCPTSLARVCFSPLKLSLFCAFIIINSQNYNDSLQLVMKKFDESLENALIAKQHMARPIVDVFLRLCTFSLPVCRARITTQLLFI